MATRVRPSMKPELRRFGEQGSPVVVIDDFSGDPRAVVEIAAALAPFPTVSGTYYPGVRRIITEQDKAAYRYAERTLEEAAQFIAGAFDCDRFDWLEASFSMVTAPPATLSPAQRAPHFDSFDPRYLAVLHFLSGTRNTGTAFYRQRSTGIERVDASNIDCFIATARCESAALSGYIQGSNEQFELIGFVEAKPDRLLIYQGCLLHSGVIPPDMDFSADPRRGRLTANLFVQGHES